MIHLRQKKKSDFSLILCWTKNDFDNDNFFCVVSDCFPNSNLYNTPKIVWKKKITQRGGRRILLMHSVFCVQKSTLQFLFIYFLTRFSSEKCRGISIMLYLHIHFYLLLFYPQMTETKHNCASPTENSDRRATWPLTNQDQEQNYCYATGFQY